ncbi:cellulose synthase operon protein C, truncation [Escherichia coli]|nr:cellulose synthase operon protein C, truncation [Escherichia coli]
MRLARGRIHAPKPCRVYPLMNLIPTDWQEEAARQSNDGGSSQGFGYTARALLERRVTSNWFVGTAIDIPAGERLRTQPFPALRTLFRRRMAG